MIKFRSFLFGLYFYVVTTICVVGFLPGLLMPPPIYRFLTKVWLVLVLFGLRNIVGVREDWQGMENLPDTPCIIACKHQSTWETVSLCLAFDLPAFILKKELQDMPLFGLYIRKLGHVAVDRTAGASALKKMIADAERTLGSGGNIIIFPEGTRVKPGDRGRYHPGVAALYNSVQYPVVPAALNSGLVWPRSIWDCKPGTITITFLPALPSDLSRRELIRQLENRIETASDALLNK